MWWKASKRYVNEELKKVKESFDKLDGDIKDLDNKFISQKEAELMIREHIITKLATNSGLNTTLNSEPNLSEPKPNLTNFEQNIVRNAIKTRPEALKSLIATRLKEGLRTSQIFNEIVKEKRLISKTQFYHYLSLVRTELRTEVRTEPNELKDLALKRAKRKDKKGV